MFIHTAGGTGLAEGSLPADTVRQTAGWDLPDPPFFIPFFFFFPFSFPFSIPLSFIPFPIPMSSFIPIPFPCLSPAPGSSSMLVRKALSSVSTAIASLFPVTKGTEAPSGHQQGYFIPPAAPFLWATVFVTPKFC